ncbi:LysR family transcriptional regulator [Paraburkholderia sp. GAS32]|uniref:LysR family transcriptional regulator n=1 Tax=Paraburkholderia sp. GAS32 TaxID=3035129 RepID=UPI003D21FCC5
MLVSSIAPNTRSLFGQFFVDKSLFLQASLPFGNVEPVMLSPIERFFSSNLKLSHLRMLVALSDLKQVTRVAAAFHVTQPAVSKQLAEIEQAMEASLTLRVGNTVQLTDVGKALARRGREILRQVDLARKDVTALVSGTAGHVVLGAVTAVPQALVSNVVMSFLSRAPAATLTFIEGPLDALHTMLLEGRVDVVLGRTKVKDDPEVVQESLYREPFVFVVGVSHPLARSSSVTLAELHNFPWLVPLKQSPSYIALARLMEDHGVDINDAWVESSSVLLNIELLARGSFVSILPLSYAREHVAHGRICLLPTPPLEQLGEVIMCRRADLENPAALVIADCVREEATDRSKFSPSITDNEYPSSLL